MDPNRHHHLKNSELDKDHYNKMHHPHEDLHDNYYNMGPGEPLGYDKGFRPAGNPGMHPGNNMTMPGNITMVPPDDQNMNYYQEYCRLFIANVVLTTQMKELVAEKNELVTRLSKLENEDLSSGTSANQESLDDKRKRFRRVATEIDRHYRCPIETCQKSYGSEGSLNQHLKLKHPELSKDPDLKAKLLKRENDSYTDGN